MVVRVSIGLLNLQGQFAEREKVMYAKKVGKQKME